MRPYYCNSCNFFDPAMRMLLFHSSCCSAWQIPSIPQKKPLLVAVFDKELDNIKAKYLDTSLERHPSATCTRWAVES